MGNRSRSSGNYLAIDYGGKRIGLATAGQIAKLPNPYGVIPNDDQLIGALEEIINQEDIGTVVVGLPRSMDGSESEQTREVRGFANQLAEHLGISVELADEALSSVRARQYLAENKTKGQAIDSVAACFILEEFLFKDNS